MDVRDSRTKSEFIKYLKNAKNERFLQAVHNFVKLHLSKDMNSLSVGFYFPTQDGGVRGEYEDTFFWECDEKFQD